MTRHSPPQCAHCDRPLRPNGQPLQDWPGTVIHRGRSLCNRCYRRHRDDYDRTTYSTEDLLAEVDQLSGRTCQDVATQLGVSMATIEAAARRANRPDLANQYGRSYKQLRRSAR